MNEKTESTKRGWLAVIVILLTLSLITGFAGAYIFAKPGPQGPIGSQGLRGEQGVQGIQGEQGVQGEQGLQGVQGEQGPQGIQGLQGYNGSQGIQGEMGSQGLQGEQGLQGIQGIQGETGPQGIQGEQGIQGIQGIQGEMGSQGLQGEQGPQGIQGETGLNGTNTIQQVLQSLNKTGQSLGSYGGAQWINMSVFDSSMQLTINVNDQSRILTEFVGSTYVEATAAIWFKILVDNQNASAVSYIGILGSSAPDQYTNVYVKFMTDALSAGQHTIDVQFYRVTGTVTILDRSLFVTELPPP